MPRWSAVRRPVHRDHSRAAQSDVVLQRNPCALDLTLVGRPAQLRGELGALGEAGSAQRVALGDQPAGGIDHPAATVGGVTLVQEQVAVALGGQTQRLSAERLVGREAIVRLDHVDVVGKRPHPAPSRHGTTDAEQLLVNSTTI